MKDDLNRILRIIEANEFRVVLGLASGFPVFIETLAEMPISRELSSLMSDFENRKTILRRIAELVNLQIDLTYRNPHDVTLATYVWALWSSDINIAEIAAGLVQEAPNTWWAHMMSRQVIEKVGTRTTSDLSYSDPVNIYDKNDTIPKNLSWIPHSTVLAYVAGTLATVIFGPSESCETGRIPIQIPIQNKLIFENLRFDPGLALWEKLWQEDMLIDTKSQATAGVGEQW